MIREGCKDKYEVWILVPIKVLFFKLDKALFEKIWVSFSFLLFVVEIIVQNVFKVLSASSEDGFAFNFFSFKSFASWLLRRYFSI